MTLPLDYRRDRAPWLAFVREIDGLELRLPDGAQRRTRFERDMRFCDDPDDYLIAVPVPDGDTVVYRIVPGPKAEAFLGELRDAVQGGV